MRRIISSAECTALGMEAKEYVVEDGNVIFFKFNVTAPAKKK